MRFAKTDYPVQVIARDMEKQFQCELKISVRCKPDVEKYILTEWL